MLKSGFFNSLNGDRLYNAEDMNSIFEGLLSDGIFQNVGDKLVVTAKNGMTVQVGTGKGYFSKHWVNNDSAYDLLLEKSDVVLNRYAAIVIKVDTTENVRNVSLYIKYSQFATTPTKPTMVRSNDVNEYCLAYIYIKAKSTAISTADIEDTRQNKALCGWVTGLVEQITPDTLYNQFTAQFNEWFNGLVDVIDSDVETALVNASPKSHLLTIEKDTWVNNEYEATVIGVTLNKSVFVESDTEGVVCIAQGNNTLTFKAENEITDDVTIKVVFMG